MESFPSKQERPKITERHFAVVLLERNGRWWIRQRTVDEVNAEFWEFPNREFDGKASPSFNQTAVAALNAKDCIATWLKIPVERLQGKPMVRHAITRYKMHQWPFSILEEPIHPKLLGNGRWASIEEIRQMPFTSSHVKILSALRPTH